MRISTLRLAVIGLFFPLSLLAGFLVVSAISSIDMHQDINTPLVVGGLLLCLMIGSGLWAHALARMLGLVGWRAGRLILAVALSNAVIIFVAILGLGLLERELVEAGTTPLPLHLLYTLLFVPTSFLTSGLLALVVIITLRGSARTALLPAIGSALTYLTLNVIQDVLGRRVGGPNAAETATMITVTLLCITGSSIAFTVVLGRLLHRILSGQDAQSASATSIAITPTA